MPLSIYEASLVRSLLGESTHHGSTTEVVPASDEPIRERPANYDAFFVYVPVSGGILALLATIIGSYLIYLHLVNYAEPVFQRYVVRVLFMIPIFSICSWGALIVPEGVGIYLESLQGIWEAYVLYNFLSLCVEFLGGAGSIVLKMDGHKFHGRWITCTCCKDGVPIDGKFIKDCKRGLIQFVLCKPMVVVIEVILHWFHLFEEGVWSPKEAYLYIMMIYNVSYSWALFSLMNFYLGCHDELAPMNPLLKFGMIKIVVFFTFWQGMVCNMLVGWGFLHEPEDAQTLKNWLLCVEMFLVSLVAPFAFSYKEYLKTATGRVETNLKASISHAFSLADFLNDTVHQFASKYHDYVLYSDMARGRNEAEGVVGTTTTMFKKGLDQILGVMTNNHHEAPEKSTGSLAPDEETGAAPPRLSLAASHAWLPGGLPRPSQVEMMKHDAGGGGKETDHAIDDVVSRESSSKLLGDQVLSTDATTTRMAPPAVNEGMARNEVANEAASPSASNVVATLPLMRAKHLPPLTTMGRARPGNDSDREGVPKLNLNLNFDINPLNRRTPTGSTLAAAAVAAASSAAAASSSLREVARTLASTPTLPDDPNHVVEETHDIGTDNDKQRRKLEATRFKDRLKVIKPNTTKLLDS